MNNRANIKLLFFAIYLLQTKVCSRHKLPIGVPEKNMRTFLHRYGHILRMQFFSLILITVNLFSMQARAQVSQTETVSGAVVKESQTLSQWCVEALGQYKNYKAKSNLEKSCEKILQKEGCASVDGKPIFHIDQKGKTSKAKNILVISVIHGDEIGAGSLGRYWFERVQEIDPRNNWRIIPVANPDGALKKSRTNAAGVDLNRNFPTADWESEAVKFWKNKSQGSIR